MRLRCVPPVTIAAVPFALCANANANANTDTDTDTDTDTNADADADKDVNVNGWFSCDGKDVAESTGKPCYDAIVEEFIESGGRVTEVDTSCMNALPSTIFHVEA